MLLFQLIAGLAVAFIIIKASHKLTSLPLYAMALMCLPCIYAAFAIFNQEATQTVVIKEMAIGIPYIAVGLMALQSKLKMISYLLAILWLMHGAYDLFHDHLFINPGVPVWYPVFCAVVDLVIGTYLLYVAIGKSKGVA